MADRDEVGFTAAQTTDVDAAKRAEKATQANRAATRQRRRAAGPGPALCELLNRVDGRPVHITNPAEIHQTLAILRRAMLWRAILERRPLVSAMPITPDALAVYHRARTHLALDKDAPDARAVERPEADPVVQIPEVGGLHHRYVHRAA